MGQKEAGLPLVLFVYMYVFRISIDRPFGLFVPLAIYIPGMSSEPMILMCAENIKWGAKMASPGRGLSANPPPCRREGAGNEIQPCLHTDNEAKRMEIRAKKIKRAKMQLSPSLG